MRSLCGVPLDEWAALHFSAQDNLLIISSLLRCVAAMANDKIKIISKLILHHHNTVILVTVSPPSLRWCAFPPRVMNKSSIIIFLCFSYIPQQQPTERLRNLQMNGNGVPQLGFEETIHRVSISIAARTLPQLQLPPHDILILFYIFMI